MGDFSASDAITAGFRLIGRNPLAVLWWALAYVVIGVLPQWLVLWSALPDMIGFYQAIGRAASMGVKPDLAAVEGFQSRMTLLQPVMILAGLASQAVLVSAIYRGVLEPESRRFGWVRFSAAELWVGLVMAVFFVLVFLAIMAVALVIGLAVGIAAIAAGAAHVSSAVWVGALLALGALAVIIWAALRFSLAFPMSFAARRFLLFESWDVTRGHGLKMFGVSLAVAIIVLLLELALVAFMFGAAFSALAHGDGSNLLAWSPQDIARRMLPWLPLWMVVGSVIGAALHAILVAPLAEIYRQLAAAGEAGAPIG